MDFDIAPRQNGKTHRTLQWLMKGEWVENRRPGRPKSWNRVIVCANEQRALNLQEMYFHLAQKNPVEFFFDRPQAVMQIVVARSFFNGGMLGRLDYELAIDDLGDVLREVFMEPVVRVSERSLTDDFGSRTVPIREIAKASYDAMVAEGYDHAVAQRIANRVIYGSPLSPAEEEAQRKGLTSALAQTGDGR